MEKKDLDLRGLLIIFVVMTLFLFGYQAYLIFFSPTPSPQPQEKAQEKPVDAPSLLLGTSREGKKPEKLRTFSFENFSITLSEDGAKVVSLLDRKYRKELIGEEEKRLNTYPLEVFTGNPELDLALNFSHYEIEHRDKVITAKLRGEGYELIKKIEYAGTHFKVDISATGIPQPFISSGIRVKEDDFFTHSGPVVKVGSDLQRLNPREIEGRELITGQIAFAGEESRYYFKGFYGNIAAVAVYRLQGQETLTLVRPQGQLIFYAGAKEYSRLREVGLSDVIDFGTLRLIVKPLFVFMYWIYEHLNSWVISIFALTLIVRLFMFPLTYKSTVAMGKMAELAPKIQELKERHKNDPARFQEEVMKLYSEVGFNPMSGCLPILLQIPIFFALYKVLTITTDLQLAGFLWIQSLAEKDPYYILPVLMGATMIAQQLVSPSPEKSQNLIMIITSVVFTFLFASFPAGLVLYWTLNNVFNMGQTYIIKKLTFGSRAQEVQKKKRKR